MKRWIVCAGAAVALGTAGAGLGAAQPWGASDPQAVCHATGSATNPYVLINPSARGAARGHAGEAMGPTTGSRAAKPHQTRGCPAPGDGGVDPWPAF